LKGAVDVEGFCFHRKKECSAMIAVAIHRKAISPKVLVWPIKGHSVSLRTSFTAYLKNYSDINILLTIL